MYRIIKLVYKNFTGCRALYQNLNCVNQILKIQMRIVLKNAKVINILFLSD